MNLPDSNFNPNNVASAKAFAAGQMMSATPTNFYKINNLSKEDQKTSLANVNFPVQMGSSDPEDYRYALQSKLIKENPNGVIPGVGQVIVGPEYMDYATRKMQVAEETKYKEWLMKQVDWNSPESTEYWVRMFPWMREERFKVVDMMAELQKREAKINIAGPQTEEDWFFLYNKARGLITVPDKPVHLLPQDTKIDYENQYERGMFSIASKLIPPYNNNTVGKLGHNPQDMKVPWANPSEQDKKVNAPFMKLPGDLQSYFTLPKNQ